jgi:drug/metabolite transporter (DMT)-like permease
VAIPDILHQDWAAVTPQAWLAVLYAGVLASAVGNVLWNTGVGRVGNTGTAVYTNVTPLFAIAAAWFLLGERITWVQVIGGIVVLAGLRLMQMERAQPIELPQGKGQD